MPLPSHSGSIRTRLYFMVASVPDTHGLFCVQTLRIYILSLSGARNFQYGQERNATDPLICVSMRQKIWSLGRSGTEM